MLIAREKNTSDEARDEIQISSITAISTIAMKREREGKKPAIKDACV